MNPSMETVLGWFECKGLLSSENAERVESALVEKGCPPTVPALRAMLQSCPQFLHELDIRPDICSRIVDAVADKGEKTYRQGREDSQQERDFNLGRESREEIPTPGFCLLTAREVEAEEVESEEEAGNGPNDGDVGGRAGDGGGRDGDGGGRDGYGGSRDGDGGGRDGEEESDGGLICSSRKRQWPDPTYFDDRARTKQLMAEVPVPWGEARGGS
jgi:hypothetical protein